MHGGARKETYKDLIMWDFCISIMKDKSEEY